MAVKTLTSLISAIAFRLGNRKGFDQKILFELQFAQQRLEEDPTIQFWFLSETTELELKANEPFVDLPSDFLREYDTFEPYYIEGGETTFLKRLMLDEALRLFADAVGPPQAYVLGDDDRLQIFPTPDQDRTITYKYVQEQPELTLEPLVDTNVWTQNASQLLMNKAGIALTQGTQNKNALANFTNDFQTSWAELIARAVEREESNMDQQRGGPS